MGFYGWTVSELLAILLVVGHLLYVAAWAFTNRRYLQEALRGERGKED
jgi:hypothetical protein